MRGFAQFHLLKSTSRRARVIESDAGFTLVELILVVAIAIVLAAVAVPIYTNLQVSAQLNDSTSLMIQTIRTAKEKSMARISDLSHGVYLSAQSYTLYQGSSYIGRDPSYDRTIELDEGLTLGWNLSGTGDANDINFSRSFGLPNKTGTITLTHDVNGVRNISINSYGKTEED